MRIARHVLRIVEVDEVETSGRRVQGERSKKKGQRDSQVEPGVVRWPYQGSPNVWLLGTLLQNVTFTPNCTARPPPVPLTPVPLPTVPVT